MKAKIKKTKTVIVALDEGEARALADSMLNDFTWDETEAEELWSDLHGVLRDSLVKLRLSD